MEQDEFHAEVLPADVPDMQSVSRGRMPSIRTVLSSKPATRPKQVGESWLNGTTEHISQHIGKGKLQEA